MSAKVKTIGFELLLISMENLQKQTAEITMKCCHRLALRAVNMAKKGTPVMDGDLKKAWTTTKPVMNGDVATCVMTNNMYYASWVEDGHRQIRRWVPGTWVGDRFRYDTYSYEGMMLKPKWIPGFHMGARAMANIDANSQTYLRNDLNTLMRQAAAKAGGKK